MTAVSTPAHIQYYVTTEKYNGCMLKQSTDLYKFNVVQGHLFCIYTSIYPIKCYF